MVSLREQTFSKQEFEVIVVDNGSVDSTASLASQYEFKLPLRVVSISRRSISAARNYGASLATGKVIAFLDADCIPHPTWLADAMNVVADNVVFGTHYKIPHQSSWVGSVWFKYQANEREGAVSFLPGGNLQMTRETFVSLGGFDELVETSEDVELCARARKRGMQVFAYPALAVVHHGTPQTLGHFYRKNHPVECHERWEFDDLHSVQRLVGVIALCPTCHAAKHIRLTRSKRHLRLANAVYAKMERVNNWGRGEVNTHIEESFKLFNERSQREWNVDISWLADNEGMLQ